MGRYASGVAMRWGEVPCGTVRWGEVPCGTVRWAGPSARRSRVHEARPEYAPALDPACDDSGADPAADADELLLLGDRIADLARRISVAEYEMMRLIVEFDRRRGWAAAGFGSCAEWLAWRTGIQSTAARERVRAALALDELPRTSAAMAAGTLSYSKVRSLTRVATPESEEALLDVAHAGSAANLERIVRAWKSMSEREELTLERIRHRHRRVSVNVDDDGSYIVKGRLEPEVGALLMRAIEAAGDALYRRELEAEEDRTDDDTRGADSAGAPDPDTTPAQRRADALGLLAERALAAGFGDGSSGTRSGTRAERYQVMLHVDARTLESGDDSGRSELDGVRVPAGTSRRLACDASVVRITDRLDVGRRTRTVPPALRRALETRDRGCRFPGCACRFTDAHHVVHWADGGRTDLKNLILLCRRHHRAVHEGGMRVCLDRAGKVVFFTPAGRPVFDAPRQGRARGGGPNDGGPNSGGPNSGAPHDAAPLPPPPASTAAWPGAPRWRYDRDIPWPIEARAWEALDNE